MVIARTAQLNTFMKGFADVFRLPAPARQPCELVAILERVVAPPQRPAGSRRDRVAVGPGRAGRPRQRRSGAARAGAPQRRQERRRGDRRDGAGGTVTIRVTSTRGPPTLVVEDSGAGLTPEAQANLFTPFFSTKPGGQGIGLTLVGEILAGHGFDYALERTDRGTTAFRITFT